MELSKDIIEKAVKSLGYNWFEKGDFNVNIVGVRNSSTKDKVTNSFDDFITISYKENGVWKFYKFKATTDAGMAYMKNPMNKNGTAILIPNQYKGSHAIGLHQGQYKALRQVGKLKIWRDSDKDSQYDYVNVTDSFNDGINIHRANKNGQSIYVEKWSAGCQVIASSKDFETFMKVIEKSASLYGNKFTYTLITSNDL
jgi:hypothetical protein